MFVASMRDLSHELVLNCDHVLARNIALGAQPFFWEIMELPIIWIDVAACS